MSKIRVLHVIKTLHLGGAETNLFNLVKALDSSKVENFVAYSFGGELEERFAKAGVGLFKFAEGNYKIKSFATGPIVFKLAQFIKKHRIQIVHTHTFNAHVWGGLAAKGSGVKILEHVHDFRYLEPAEFVRRRGENRQYWSVKHLRNFSDGVVVLTEQNRDFILRHRLYSPEKVALIPNGIDLSQGQKRELNLRNSFRDQFGLSPSARVILTPIRIAPEKNVDLILRIASQVVAHNPDAVFVIAGEGPLLDSFKEQVRAQGLDSYIRFVGFVSDMPGLLNLADIFLLPSFLELHSIALLEAMNQGCPVVLSRGAGSHEGFIKDGENGVLMDPFSDDGWANALTRLLRDPVARQKMGQAGLATCRERFDIKKTASSFENLYEKLLR